MLTCSVGSLECVPDHPRACWMMTCLLTANLKTLDMPSSLKFRHSGSLPHLDKCQGLCSSSRLLHFEDPGLFGPHCCTISADLIGSVPRTQYLYAAQEAYKVLPS